MSPALAPAREVHHTPTMPPTAAPLPTLRDATVSDAPAVARIYNHAIVHSIATFEETPLETAELAARIRRVAEQNLPWLVVTEGDAVLAYAYATPWHHRCAFRHTVETSVYVDEIAQGRGIGARVYGALLEQLRTAGMRTALAGIALPNEASVRLHERLGFEPAGCFREVGFKFGRWIDVGYWQLCFERATP